MLQNVLSALPWSTITPVGLSVSFAWVVIKGLLIPRSWVDKSAADQDSRIEFLENANTAQRATIDSLVQQNAELSASGRLSVALLQSLQALSTNHAAGSIEPGSGHVASPSID